MGGSEVPYIARWVFEIDLKVTSCAALTQGVFFLRIILGMRARGLTVEALKGFIASQGASSSNLLMEWDQLWAWNKKVLDPIAPRFWAVAEEDL